MKARFEVTPSARLTFSNQVPANVLENESVIHRIRLMKLTQIISTRRPGSPWMYSISAIA
jgi:hypothetical protein